MSVSSISSISPTGLTSAAPDALGKAIEAFIHQFPYTDLPLSWDPNSPKAFLQECLNLAGSDPSQIARIKEAVDALNEDDCGFFSNDLLTFLIRSNEPSLALLLIDLKINEIYKTGYDTPLSAAVEKGNSELVSELLKNGAPPEPDSSSINLTNMTSPLYAAVKSGNSEYVKLLLQAGADPNACSVNSKLSPFELAVFTNKTSLMPLFFLYKHPRFSIDADTAITKIKKSVFAVNPDFKADFQRRLARALPPLVKGISCFVGSIAGREKAIKHFIDPLTDPPASIKELIDPIQAFVSKESLKDPQFTITIVPKIDDDTLGGYLYKTGNIEISMDDSVPTSERSKVMPSLQTLSEEPNTTLIHEICHKALDKVKWKQEEIIQSSVAAAVDIRDLSHRWEYSNRFVNALLNDVSTSYTPNQRVEEYIVRVPEILHAIAHEDPTLSLQDVEKIVEKDIPNLYRIYKKKFLPTLVAYNSASATRQRL